MPEAWTDLQSRTVLECPVFRIAETKTKLPAALGGQIRNYYRIEAKDWVNVIPTTASGEILMIRQYRHGSQEITLELPGGEAGPGETPAAAAARELLEETGMRPARMKKLGALRPNPALMNNLAHTFLAECCAPAQATPGDSDEDIELVRIAPETIPARIQSGEIQHALMVAALHLWTLSA